MKFIQNTESTISSAGKNISMAEYQCPYCTNTRIIPKTKASRTHTCGNIACRRAHVDASIVLPDSKYCKLVKELGVQSRVNSVGTTISDRMATFECQHCGIEFTRPRYLGIDAKSCGAKECVAATRAPIDKQVLIDNSTKHGMVGTRIYNIWKNMLQRCTNPNSDSYNDYGAKGIKVSPEWQEFITFYADMGEAYDTLAAETDMTIYSLRPSIERINPALGYNKGNCEWITFKENVSRAIESKWAHLKSKIVVIKLNGEMVGVYDSTQEAVAKLSEYNLSTDHIHDVAVGTRASHKQLVFKYAEDYAKLPEGWKPEVKGTHRSIKATNLETNEVIEYKTVREAGRGLCALNNVGTADSWRNGAKRALAKDEGKYKGYAFSYC